jgi:hypothetical protein
LILLSFSGFKLKFVSGALGAPHECANIGVGGRFLSMADEWFADVLVLTVQIADFRGVM